MEGLGEPNLDSGGLSDQLSTGTVQQRLASDSIHQYTVNPAHLGSTAELVDLTAVERQGSIKNLASAPG
jgi:hypothetical protein